MCLRQAGIKLQDTRDQLRQHRFNHLNITNLLKNDVPDWYHRRLRYPQEKASTLESKR